MSDTAERPVGRINACRLALAIAIVWGLGIFILGVVTVFTQEYGHKFVETFGSIYWGYKPTWGGAFTGLGWALVDGYVGTRIIAGVYNLLCGCGSNAGKSCDPQP
jgi:hypothetical protein